ncbi:hypothetical protein EON65_39460, partial [archaeon]
MEEELSVSLAPVSSGLPEGRQPQLGLHVYFSAENLSQCTVEQLPGCLTIPIQWSSLELFLTNKKYISCFSFIVINFSGCQLEVPFLEHIEHQLVDLSKHSSNVLLFATKSNNLELDLRVKATLDFVAVRMQQAS